MAELKPCPIAEMYKRMLDWHFDCLDCAVCVCDYPQIREAFFEAWNRRAGDGNDID